MPQNPPEPTPRGNHRDSSPSSPPPPPLPCSLPPSDVSLPYFLTLFPTPPVPSRLSPPPVPSPLFLASYSPNSHPPSLLPVHLVTRILCYATEKLRASSLLVGCIARQAVVCRDHPMREQIVNTPHKAILFTRNPVSDVRDCRDVVGMRPRRRGTREIPISDSLVQELLALGKGLLFRGTQNVEQTMLREIQRQLSGSGYQRSKCLTVSATHIQSRNYRDSVGRADTARCLGMRCRAGHVNDCAWLDSQSEAARRTRQQGRHPVQSSGLPAAEEENRHEQDQTPKASKKLSSTTPKVCRDGDAFSLILSVVAVNSHHVF